jgi:hypothetical protein
MHLPPGSDRLQAGNTFSRDAQMNYVGIDHHRQYSHMALSITIFSKSERGRRRRRDGRRARWKGLDS